MKIRYTERTLVRRFGKDPVTVSDEHGARLMKQGVAVAVTSFDTPPIDLEAKTSSTAKSSKLLRWVVGSGSVVLHMLDGYRTQKSMVVQNLVILQ